MARYRVHFQTVASTSIEVTADSPDEAIDAAYETGDFPRLCAQCSGYSRKHSLDLSDNWEPAVNPGEGEESCVEEI